MPLVADSEVVSTIKGVSCVVEYEPDANLRDTEQVPLTEAGGVDEFIKREVLPYASDAWFDEDGIKVGYLRRGHTARLQECPAYRRPSGTVAARMANSVWREKQTLARSGQRP